MTFAPKEAVNICMSVLLRLIFGMPTHGSSASEWGGGWVSVRVSVRVSRWMSRCVDG